MEQIEKVPYQKGLITLSLLVLIYCYGEGEFSSSLTIALVGLTLNKPEVLEILIFSALLWYTWRFYITGNWSVRGYVEDVAKNIFTNSTDLDSWEKLSTEQALKIYPEDEAFGTEPDILSNTRVEGNFSSTLILEYSNSYNRTSIVAKKVPWAKRVEAQCIALYLWLTRHDLFAYRYLPMGVAFAAITSGLCKAIVGT